MFVCIGVCQQVGGIAKETVDTIMEILADVDAISTPCTSSSTHTGDSTNTGEIAPSS